MDEIITLIHEDTQRYMIYLFRTTDAAEKYVNALYPAFDSVIDINLEEDLKYSDVTTVWRRGTERIMALKLEVKG